MTTSLPATPGSFERYVAAINAVPLLAETEERELAARARERRDRAAAARLVLSHLRLVVKIARGYEGYGLPLADLVQEGTVGLVLAVRRFDPARRVRLAAYAAHYVRAAIHEYVIRNWRVVRVATTKAQRKLFFNLRTLRRHVGRLSRSERAAIAESLDVDAEAVREMEGRLLARDVAIAPVPDDEEALPGTIADLADDGCDVAERSGEEEFAARRAAELARALDTLDPRSRDVVESRWLTEERLTLEALAARYRVSRERIRQIEAAALAKLRRRLESDAPDLPLAA